MPSELSICSMPIELNPNEIVSYINLDTGDVFRVSKDLEYGDYPFQSFEYFPKQIISKKPMCFKHQYFDVYDKEEIIRFGYENCFPEEKVPYLQFKRFLKQWKKRWTRAQAMPIKKSENLGIYKAYPESETSPNPAIDSNTTPESFADWLNSGELTALDNPFAESFSSKLVKTPYTDEVTIILQADNSKDSMLREVGVYHRPSKRLVVTDFGLPHDMPNIGIEALSKEELFNLIGNSIEDEFSQFASKYQNELLAYYNDKLENPALEKVVKQYSDDIVEIAFVNNTEISLSDVANYRVYHPDKRFSQTEFLEYLANPKKMVVEQVAKKLSNSSATKTYSGLRKATRWDQFSVEVKIYTDALIKYHKLRSNPNSLRAVKQKIMNSLNTVSSKTVKVFVNEEKLSYNTEELKAQLRVDDQLGGWLATPIRHDDIPFSAISKIVGGKKIIYKKEEAL